MYSIYIILSALIVIGIVLRKAGKRAEKIDAENTNRYSKEEHEYFSGIHKPKINYKGKTIEMDEHYGDIDLVNREN